MAQLEGDAVFSHDRGNGSLRGQTLVEIIEDTYVAFKRTIELMVLNTTCSCNACANISHLDLKFVVHHGEFAEHNVAGRNEVLGPAVVAVHRLLENGVVASTGIGAYTIYSQAAIDALDLRDFLTELVPHAEEYEDIGRVSLWVQDMHPLWDARKESVRVTIPERDVLVMVEGDLPVPVAAAWDVLARPEYRAVFMHAERQEVAERGEVRLGTGSVFRCFHGSGRITTQTVVDWQPFLSMTTEDTTPVPRTTVLIQIELEPTGGGTRIRATARRARGAFLPRTICNAAGRFAIRSGIGRGPARLEQVLASEVSAGKRDVAAAIPVSPKMIQRAAADAAPHTP